MVEKKLEEIKEMHPNQRVTELKNGFFVWMSRGYVELDKEGNVRDGDSAEG